MTKAPQQLSSEKFDMGDAAKMIDALISIRSLMKLYGMTNVERMGHPTGTYVIYLEDKIRLIIQYDARRDVNVGRFDVLGMVDA